MYNLLDLKSDSTLTKEIDDIEKEEILSIYDDYFLHKSINVKVFDLKNILKDDSYYVGVDYFVNKGKKNIYKGRIVVAYKDDLIEYLINTIEKNDVRNIFVIPRNDKNMILFLNEEGGMIAKK